MSQYEVVLLLGSNLGNPKENIKKALKYIENEAGNILKKSEFLETKPVEFVSNNIFCNIAVLLKTEISPIKLLKTVKTIEKRMGRLEDSGDKGFYEDRIIDIDIVCYSNLIFENKVLIIPHKKHLFERDFSKKLLIELKQKNT